MIKTAGNCIQPSQEDILKIVDSLKPLFENVSNLKEENSWNREWSNHFSSVAAGAICIKWVIVSIIFFGQTLPLLTATLGGQTGFVHRDHQG